jgi:hypothetical protein
MAIDAAGLWTACFGTDPERSVPPDLGAQLDEYRARTARAIGPLEWIVDGDTFPGFFEALSDPARPFDTLVIVGPDAPAGPAWEFLRPFTHLAMGPDGRATITHSGRGPPETGIARLLPRESFLDATYGIPGPVRGPLPWPAFVKAVREGSFLPFGVALELYCSNERVRFEVDLVDSRLLTDPRSGRLPRSARVHWAARGAWRLDHLLGRLSLSPESTRLVELIAETDSLSGRDLGRLFPGLDVEALLPRLGELGLIATDPSTGHWRFRREAIRPAPRRGARPGAGPRPALHRSMNELLDAADSRATCPMCGEEFPAGPHGLLCRRCEREVAGPAPR